MTPDIESLATQLAPLFRPDEERRLRDALAIAYTTGYTACALKMAQQLDAAMAAQAVIARAAA